MQRLPKRRDEIGKLSESLIDLTDELQKRMAATAGFAADVAHELKNLFISQKRRRDDRVDFRCGAATRS